MRDLLSFSRELAAIGQAGITYSRDPYDRDRFIRLREMAGELLSMGCKAPVFKWPEENGYDTPKVDVRAFVFRDDEVLLIKESVSGLWTVPGGWADVNFSPAENAERECLEESGFQVRAKRAISLIDKERAGYPRDSISIYKLGFLFDIIGGKPATGIESSAVQFFPMDGLPPLDPDRIRKEDLVHAHESHLDSNLAPDFN